MMNELEIQTRWESDKPSYEAWGEFIKEKIIEGLSLKVDCPEIFLRLPVKCRLKDESSLVKKALHRGKGYENPYADIEDKVGMRFVVLTSDEIKIVEEIITKFGQTFWHHEKSRDFLAERESKPWEFGYQSVHYIVRAKSGLEMDGTPIPLDIPCEIQVRTMLQHAFSELTHDTIYKPSVKSTPDMLRAAAKAMALIEATDDYFRTVGNIIRKSVKEVRDLLNSLSNLYKDKVGFDAVISELDGEVVDSYIPLLTGTSFVEIERWLEEKPFVFERIARRRHGQAIFTMPSVLLLYYSVGNFPSVAASPDVISPAELQVIYSDLGKALPW